MSTDFEKNSQSNFLALKDNPCPGPGIIMGLDETRKFLIQVCWIVGGNDNSKNRIFISKSRGIVKIIPFNSNKVIDPNPYIAMAEDGFDFVVSNGDQTADGLKSGDLDQALENWIYELDPPNFTPRITARFSFADHVSMEFNTAMLVLKKSPVSNECERYPYKPPMIHGFGYCVTTYVGDGNPLPPFKGGPYLLPLKGGIKDIAGTYWSALNPENKVSLAVKFINIATRESIIEIVNRHQVDFGYPT